MQFAKTFKYVEKLETGETENIDEGDTKEKIIANVRAGYEVMFLIKQGKLEGIPWEDFLKEL